MQVAARQEDLKLLGQLLQERLQSELEGEFFQVRCAVRDKTLIVLSQHPDGVAPDTLKTFEALQQALEALQPQVTQSVQLFIRLAGQKQPYAKHSFILQPPVLEKESLPLNEPVQMPASWGNPASELTDSSKMAEFNSQPIEEPLADASGLSSTLVPVKQTRQIKLPRPLLVVGAAIGLAALICGGYLLTRPCVIGECVPIQTAQQLSQESAQAARRAKSVQHLKVAVQQLKEADDGIQTIPAWSPRYQEAQQLSQTFSTQSEKINRVITALEKADSAAKQGQSGPIPPQQLQAIQALWQQAITTLEAIPPNSVLAPLAQQKLPQYRASLKAVNQQINAEQQAAKNLTRAKATALVALQRQGAAQSLQNWQQVQSTWQVAVNILAAIPTSLTAYTEAQELLENYRPKLAAVRERTTKERIAAKFYNQAVASATLAKSYLAQNQFTLTVTNWSNAINAVKQIPTGTFYHSQAQTLIDTYTTNLNQAQEKLQVANNLQKARADLDKICFEATVSIRFCNYSLSQQGISVQLTAEYERAMNRSFITAGIQRDANAQVNVVGHLQALMQALEVISQNANLPLAIYDAKGNSIPIQPLVSQGY